MIGSPRICCGRGPMDCCLPLVLAPAAGPGCRSSVMVTGDTLVDLGCPAEGADAGSNRLLRISLRGSHVPLRRRNPLAECPVGGGVVALSLQLVNPRADSADALPDLLPTAPRRFWLVHASSMPAPGR
jgi:hypothetical protein